MRSAVAAATLLLSAVTFASCGGSGYQYEPPTPENDGWSVGSAAEAGFDLDATLPFLPALKVVDSHTPSTDDERTGVRLSQPLVEARS